MRDDKAGSLVQSLLFRDVQGLSVAPAKNTEYNPPPFNVPWAQTNCVPGVGFEPMCLTASGFAVERSDH